MSRKPPNKSDAAHKIATLGYLLFGLGIIFGITALIGVLINHAHLKKAHHTYSYSHLKWQILSFWLLCTGVVVCIMLLPSELAMVPAGICLLWWGITTIIGSWVLYKRKPLPFL